MRKKILALTMMVVMTAMTVVGCGNSEKTKSTDSADVAEEMATETKATAQESENESGEKVVLKLAWWGNQLRNDITKQAADRYMELRPDVQIELEFSDWSGYWDKLSAEAAGGNLPDIMQMDYSYLEQYVNSGLLADMTPYFEDGTISTELTSESIVNSAKVNDKLYGVCLGVNAPALFYDVETVNEAGITIPDQMTYEELFEIGKDIDEKTGVKTIFEDQDAGMIMFGRAYGKNMYDEIKAGNTDLMKKYFEYVNMFTSDDSAISNEKRAEKSNNQVELMPIVDKSTWCTWATSNQLAVISNAAGREIGITMFPIPADYTVNAMYLKPSSFFVASDNCENKKAAAEFMDWFVNDIECNQILMAERGVPANSEVADAIKPELDEETQKTFDYITKVTAVATTINPPDPAGRGEVAAKNDEYAEYIRMGDMDAVEAAEEYVSQAQRILNDAQ